MKRAPTKIIIILVFHMLALTTACNVDKSNMYLDSLDFELEEHANSYIIEDKNDKLEFFHVSEITPGEYEYTVYNRKGEIVYTNIANRLPPTIYMIDTNLIWIEVGIGTATTQVRLFDLDSDFLSDWFMTPRAAKNNLVVLMEWNSEGKPVLIVRDIFNNNVMGEFYREFSPVANIGGILLEAEFISNNHIRVNYLSGNDFVETEEIICLDIN